MSHDFQIIKYPRTPHLEGSRLQAGDESLGRVPFAVIAGRHLVVEEKIDGANVAVSFDGDGGLLLQSRGHYLTGGARDRHYDLLKQWASVHRDVLWATLGCRYVMYGEWMWAKHSIYYDALPHYFMEFDILDRTTQHFLDTPGRRRLTVQLPVCSVPVLASGRFDCLDDVLRLLGPSLFITDGHLDSLRRTAGQLGLDADAICRQTETGTTMEGLYIKVEDGGCVTDRVKWVRNTFTQTQEVSRQAWLDRAIVPNGLSVPLTTLFDPNYPPR